MQKFGVDLSHHNGGINFNVLKNKGVEFAILRAGYTGYGDGISKAKDTQFENFYNECKKYNIGVGAYWFSCANTYDKGVAEANYMYENCLKGKIFDYPIYIDVEDDTGGKYYLRNAGREKITDGICGFCERLEQLGFYVGIYANLDWFKNFINNERVKRYDKWLAYWTGVKPNISLKYEMWQFGGEQNFIQSALIDNQYVDQDYVYIDYPDIIKNGGFNGFTKQINDTPKNDESNNDFVLLDMVRKTIRGDFGNGEERKNTLGDKYDEVQKQVNLNLNNGLTKWEDIRLF